ncbi:MAG: TolC family protein [Myxococcota bacterium]
MPLSLLALSLAAWAAPPDDRVRVVVPEVTLAQAMDAAGTDGYGVTAAAAGERVAQARVVQTRAGLLPTLTAQAGVQRWDSATEVQFIETDEPLDCTTFEAVGMGDLCASFGEPIVVREEVTSSVTLRVVAPLTGLVSGERQLAAATKGRDAARIGSEGATETARQQAADAWYAALDVERQIEIARSQVESLDARGRTMEVALAAGNATRNDVLQVTLAAAQARQAVLQLEALRDSAYRRLGLAMGGVGGAVRPAGGEEITTRSVPNRETTVRLALERRPDLGALRAQVDALRASATALSWSRLPQVSAIGSYTHQEGQGFGAAPDSGFVGLQADWTIWAWDRQAAGARAARAQADQLAAQLAGAEAGARAEVEGRLDALRTAQASWEVATGSVEVAQENLRLFEVRQRAGTATTLELLDAQTSLVRAQSGEATARYGIGRAVAALVLAVGEDPWAGAVGNSP